jgi:hypothetical protein
VTKRRIKLLTLCEIQAVKPSQLIPFLLANVKITVPAVEEEMEKATAGKGVN